MTNVLPSLIIEYQKIVQSLPDTNKCKSGIKEFLSLMSNGDYDTSKLIKSYSSQTERCYRYTTQLQNGFMCGLCNSGQADNFSKFTKFIQLNESECKTFSRACVPRLQIMKKMLKVIVMAYNASRCNV